jgi:hypothetical protein
VETVSLVSRLRDLATDRPDEQAFWYIATDGR